LLKKIISVGALELDRNLFQKKVAKILKKDNWSDIYQMCGHPELCCKLKNNIPKIVRWPGPPSKRKLKCMRKCEANFANGDALRIIRDNLLPECKEINLGIDIEKFYPIEKKNDKKTVEFLFVGRIVPIKNLSFLINSFKKALQKNNNIILKIVGDGDDLQNIKKLASEIKNIKFLGRKSGDELVKIYQESDVFCITSKYDNFPNVVFEAMACGLPVIGTKVGGIPMQVDDGITGILVELNNEKELINAILKLANDKSLREKMGKLARKKIEKEFSWDKSAEKLEKLYYERLKCVE
jgi:glycosyltransferase involved in cell wall biosynthesis